LFSEVCIKYPLRPFYHCGPSTDNQKIKWAFLFPRKKAVDRNYFKRILRETYRLNKHILINNMDTPCSFMFFYQTKDRLSYEINTKTIQLFEKFIAQNGKKAIQ
jgi:ribonuclease P protein component